MHVCMHVCMYVCMYWAAGGGHLECCKVCIQSAVLCLCMSVYMYVSMCVSMLYFVYVCPYVHLYMWWSLKMLQESEHNALLQRD
jgi:hypothetical protein